MRMLAPWIVALAILLVAGMTWVNYRNQSVTLGREIKRLEKQIADLDNDIEALRPRINKLYSRNELQARLNEGFIKMVPISPNSIVQVNFPPENGIRTVSIERTAP